MHPSLPYVVKREIAFAAKYLARDNYLCDLYLERLLDYETLSPEEQQRQNNERLLRTFQIAAQRIVRYGGIRTDFEAVDAPQALRELYPIVTKEDLLNQTEEFYPNRGKIRPWMIASETGGTTGTPLRIVCSLKSVIMENAFLRRHLSWSGFQKGMRRATLRGDMVIPAIQKEPPYWYYNRYNKQMILSTSHLSPRTADAYIAKIEEFSPFLMQAYPSVAYELAGYLREKDRKVNVPYIFTQSESLLPFQRQLIEDRFQGQTFEHYGCGERVAFATGCEEGNLHLNLDYSHVEIVDEQGKPTDDYGYLVGTTYHNDAMPLVRYRMSDVTKWKAGVCPCGRVSPMIEQIKGRVEDAIIGTDGSNIGPLLYRILKGVERVRKTQVAQVDRHLLEIRVVPGPGYGEAEGEKLIRNLHQLVDKDIGARLVIVDEIPRTTRGKQRWIVNEYVVEAETP